MRTDRRGLTVLSLVIILVVIGLLVFFLLRGRDAAGPTDVSPDAVPMQEPVATTEPGAVLTALRAPLSPVVEGRSDTVVVALANAAGVPMTGVTVRFATTEGEGRVVPTEARTDSAGRAVTVWTYGPMRGTNTLRVEADAPRTPVEPLLLTVQTDSLR